MHTRSFLPLFIIVVSCAGLALTASVPSEVDNTKDSGITAVNKKFIWSFYNVAAIGTAVFVTSLVISVMLNLPFLAQILCYKFGILCIDPFASFEGYRSININDRHKRSLEYVEPILTTLTKAYEAFADDDLKKVQRSKILKMITILIQLAPIVIGIFNATFLIIHLVNQLYKSTKTAVSLLSLMYQTTRGY